MRLRGVRNIGWLFLCGATVAMATAKPNPEELPDLVALVSPAVVNIQTTKLLKNTARAGYIATLADPGVPGIENYQTSLGSGFVVASTKRGTSRDGSAKLQEVLILTNDHVISQADEIEVMTAGNRERFRAVVVAKDPQTDIAVLKTVMPASIHPLKLGSSEALRVGESIFAIGNPFGLGHTVTTGIVSAKDRSLGIGRADRYLQTDAAINFGNSGGPLFNMKGEVVGINTLVRVDAQGIGFAIPSDTVKKLLPTLEDNGRVERSWLGIVAANESTALRTRYGIQGPTFEGVIVTHLVKDAPGHKLELEEGDLITGIGSQGKLWPVTTVTALRDILESLPPGTAVEVRIRRGSKQFLGKMRLEAMPTSDRLPEGHDYY
jgi:serine protease Do